MCAEAVKQTLPPFKCRCWVEEWNRCYIATNKPVLRSADGGLTGSMLCSKHILASSSSRSASRGVPQHLPGCSTGPPVVQHFMGSFHHYCCLLPYLCRQLLCTRMDGCEGGDAAVRNPTHLHRSKDKTNGFFLSLISFSSSSQQVSCRLAERPCCGLPLYTTRM